MNDTIDILMRIEKARPEAIIEWWNLYCFDKSKMIYDMSDFDKVFDKYTPSEIGRIIVRSREKFNMNDQWFTFHGKKLRSYSDPVEATWQNVNFSLLSDYLRERSYDLLDMNYGIPETLKAEIKEILKNRD